MRGWRSLLVAVVAVAYVALSSLLAPGSPDQAAWVARTLAWGALFGMPLVLSLVWRGSAVDWRGDGSAVDWRGDGSAVDWRGDGSAVDWRGDGSAVDWRGDGSAVDDTARGALRACVTGAAMLLAARTGPEKPQFVALANAGAALAAMSGLAALARLPAPGGLAQPTEAARRLDAVAFVSLLWTVAVALPAARWIAPERAHGLDPVAVDYATIAASTASLGLLVASAARARVLRLAELGTAERAGAAAAIASAALVAGVLAVVLGVAAAEQVLPGAAALAALGAAWAAVVPDAARVPATLRRLLTMAALAAAPTAAGVVAARLAPRQAPAIVLGACGLVATLSTLASRIEARLAPVAARRLRALEAATRAAMDPDPDRALEHALLALRASARPRRVRAPGPAVADARPRDPSPALYRLLPPELVRVDRAGFVEVERADVPPLLVDLADGEPERVLRIEALRTVEVRRPEVRALVAWLEERGLGAVAVVRDAEEPIALLAMPEERAARLLGAGTTLEQARAISALCRRLAAVVGVSSLLARSRARELEARAGHEAAGRALHELEASLATRAGRIEAIAAALERPARFGAYGPAARAAIGELERLAAGGKAVTLLVPPGVDAIAWAALVHRASPRRSGALAIVDGASPAEHDLAGWRDPERSPIAAATGGTLVVLDPQALPAPVQTYLAAAFPDGAGVVVTVPITIDALVATGRLDEQLADRLGDRAVAIPTLAARGDDLRALALDQLARIGLRTRGRPLGLDLAALALLGEHGWPANDAELISVLVRAAAHTRGDVVGVADLHAAGFSPTAHATPSEAPSMIPSPRRRRAKR